MFWKTDQASPAEITLYRALFKAHALSAQRENASSYAVLNAYSGSGDYAQAIAAALMTLGGNHAPLAETHDFLSWQYPERFLGGVIPGWGNSFVKGEEDEIWDEVKAILVENWPIIAHKLQAVTDALHARGKIIFPNPSAYTAACALALGCPREVLPFLFIASRLPAWSTIVMNAHRNILNRKAA